MNKAKALLFSLLMIAASLAGCMGGEDTTNDSTVSELENEVAMQDDKIAELELEVENLESQHQDAMAEITTIQFTLQTTQTSLNSAEANTTMHLADISLLESEKNIANSEILMLNELIINMSDQSNETIDDFITQIVELNQNLSSLSSLLNQSYLQLQENATLVSQLTAECQALQSALTQANNTIATLQTGWSIANSTIASLIGTQSMTTLSSMMEMNYSPICRGKAKELIRGLDNGDGNGTMADGQLHVDEVDSSDIICSPISMVIDDTSDIIDLIWPFWGCCTAVVGNTLYFVGDDGVNGNELWKSDGTETGTMMVKDISSGNPIIVPSRLTSVGNTLYFISDDGTNGVELWKSDGTEAGTMMVKDINSGNGHSWPFLLGSIGNTIYFAADDGIHGNELWKSDGTEAGTVMISDIRAGSDDSLPEYYLHSVIIGNTIYFTAEDGSHGVELWKSDGTNSGTTMVKDINNNLLVDANGSYPNDLTAIGNTLYFEANDGNHGNELWKSDGTSSGTFMVKDIMPGDHYGSNPHELIVVGNTLYFVGDDGVNGYELWKSDGTEAGTVMVKQIHIYDSSDPSLLTVVGNMLYFVADTGASGIELWKSDGTQSGTIMIKDINPQIAHGSEPDKFTVVGSTLFFEANDGVYGDELWVTDGTVNGTLMIRDFCEGSCSTNFSPFWFIGDTIYFTTDSGIFWKYLI